MTLAVTVVETGLLLAADVLPLLAADVVITRLVGMRDVTETTTDVTGTGTVIASASVNATGLAAPMTVTGTETSKMIVTDRRTENVVMTSTTLPQMETTEKVSLSLMH